MFSGFCITFFHGSHTTTFDYRYVVNLRADSEDEDSVQQGGSDSES
jgi:hypothetical protein